VSRKVEIEIVGMADESAAASVTAALQKLPGVSDVRVDSDSGRATAMLEKGVFVEHLLETVEEVGFMARLAQPDDD
jgi:copper chaperone CopZ